MEKKEAQAKIAALESEIKSLMEIVNQPDPKPEDRFLELILQTNSIKLDQNKYPSHIFGFIGNEFLWEYNLLTGELWLSYKKIFSILEKEFSLSYSPLCKIIIGVIQTNLNITVDPGGSRGEERYQVEQHFFKINN